MQVTVSKKKFGGEGVIWLKSSHPAFRFASYASVGKLGSSLEMRLRKFLTSIVARCTQSRVFELKCWSWKYSGILHLDK